MPIYTKRGDRGLTSLFSGERVKKSDLRVAAVGELDELSTIIGWAKLTLPKRKFELEDIQRDLYWLSSLIDGADVGDTQRLPKRVRDLEAMIDAIEENLPPLREFIVPGQSEPGCRAHIARVVARRVERSLVDIAGPFESAISYVNRLSDLLFVIARDADRELLLADGYLKSP